MARESCGWGEKEKILLHTVKGDEGGFKYGEFYTIDLRKGKVSECPYALLADSGMNSMVALGSVIYIVGGRRFDRITCKKKPPNSSCNKEGLYHKGMSYLDLTNFDFEGGGGGGGGGGGWKQALCPSEGPTSRPCVVALGGKIYFFHRGDQSLTGEVFDPISNKWETLFPPPDVGFFDILYVASAVADPENNRILVHFLSIHSVYAYYPADNRWELVLRPFSWSSQLVFVDGVIYFYLPGSPELVAAYHIATKEWLNIVFTSEMSDRVWRYEFDVMFYLGNGLMCLAAYSPGTCPPRTQVFIAKFRFDRPADRPADLLVTPLPLDTYVLDTFCRVSKYLPI